MTPAHHSSERRWGVVAVVVLVIAAVAVVAATRSTTPVGAQPVPGAMVSAPNAESSAWYCTGQSTASGVALGSLLLSNTTTHAATGTITVVTDAGSSVLTAVAVPARDQVIPALPSPTSGSWVSDIVTIAGGGVDVSQLVHGTTGWSVAPCVSTTSATWYFPDGSTAASDGLDVSLLNPTSTPVVVDLSFVTPSGTLHPINFQGIVLRPDQLQVENVASEVQDQSNVATVATARTGRVVAGETQTFVGPPQSGLSVVPGLPNLESDWFIPQGQELSGGSGEIAVFNPGGTTEDVTVQLRLASGPLAPLTDRVPPGTAWILSTSAQTRIPRGDVYSAVITASGGPGVVVGRMVHAPSTAAAPQAGLGNAIDGLSTQSPSQLWVVQPPGTGSAPVVSGAEPYQLALLNTSDGSASYAVFALSPSGTRSIASGTLAAGASTLVGGATLANAGFDQIIVRSGAAVAVAEDMGPTGNYGVVAVPGIPLATAIPL
jgi:hypothetical protein